MRTFSIFLDFRSRVRRIRNFFIRFEANPSEYGSYSLHIRMFRYISKQHLFALHILFKIFAQINTQIFEIHVAANVRFRANTLLRFSHTGEYLLQNIRLDLQKMRNRI